MTIRSCKAHPVTPMQRRSAPRSRHDQRHDRRPARRHHPPTLVLVFAGTTPWLPALRRRCPEAPAECTGTRGHRIPMGDECDTGIRVCRSIACRSIMLQQSFADIAGGHSHNGVLGGVVVRGAAEQRDSDYPSRKSSNSPRSECSTIWRRNSWLRGLPLNVGPADNLGQVFPKLDRAPLPHRLCDATA